MRTLSGLILCILAVGTLACRSVSVYGDASPSYRPEQNSDRFRPAPPIRDREPRMSGMVFDGETNQSLAGAVITIMGRSAVSDENGRYLFDGLRPGSYEVTVSKPGYVSLTERMTVRDDSPNVLNFSLELKQ